MSTLKKDPKNLVIILLSAILLVMGFSMLRSDKPVQVETDHAHGESESKVEVWTCSMHPQIRVPEPGLCPLCGMDLIPESNKGDEGGPWELSMSEHARKLAEIQVTPAIRKLIPHEIRMMGKIAYDEKRVSDITAWVPGRIDRLFVDFTGIEVIKGDHMVELYSPDLVSAQQELRQALRSLKNGPASMKKATQGRVTAARKKLELFGLSESQIKTIEARKTTRDHLVVEAPMSGIVIKKHLNEGAYVKTGSLIYTIADLSRVWIQLDAYESDLAWLRYGQEVEFEVEAYPGETLTGRIVFIDPSLNPSTRTIKVRIDIPNPDGKLKPDMFVRATAHALVSQEGKVMDPSLAGKWIGRMHPEIVKDEAGTCDICGMDLTKAEDLGFITAESTEAPIIIPASAALVTGERAVVYVAIDEDAGRYEGREIVLGPELGDYYVVRSGLAEGEMVVVNGAFKIDSELQIRAKYSMMYHPSKPSKPKQGEPVASSDTFALSLRAIFTSYFEMHGHFSKDELHPAHQAGASLATALAAVAVAELSPKARRAWESDVAPLSRGLQNLSAAEEIDQARIAFNIISNAMHRIAERFGLPPETNVYLFNCPMAFENKGANWLQTGHETANPYYGSAMFSCGSEVKQVTHQFQEQKNKEEGGQDHD